MSTHQITSHPLSKHPIGLFSDFRRVPAARERRRPRGCSRDRHGVHRVGEGARHRPPHSDHRLDLRQAELRRADVHRQPQPVSVRRFPQQPDRVPDHRRRRVLLGGGEPATAAMRFCTDGYGTVSSALAAAVAGEGRHAHFRFDGSRSTSRRSCELDELTFLLRVLKD